MKKTMRKSVENRLVIERETVKMLVTALPYATLGEVQGGGQVTSRAQAMTQYTSSATTQQFSQSCTAIVVNN